LISRRNPKETTDVRIPCEYCDKGISLNDLESHSVILPNFFFCIKSIDVLLSPILG